MGAENNVDMEEGTLEIGMGTFICNSRQLIEIFGCFSTFTHL